MSVLGATVKLGSVARMTSGGTPPSGVSRYYGGDIPWVSIADMTSSGKYIAQTDKTLSEEGLAVSAAKLYEPDVVLYAMYASLGECSLARGPVSSSQAILGINPGPRLDREYLYYYLQFVKPSVKLMGQQGTQSNLNAGMVRDFEIPLPSVPEQKWIAGVLGSVDELISSIERAIAKKLGAKQGIMQELLTGGTRLPGFGGAWATRPVAELLEFKNGLNKSSEFFGRGTPIVNFMDVMRAPFIRSRQVEGLVTLSRDEIKRFSARRGDLFFTRTSETVEEVGTASVLMDDISDASFSGFVLRGRPKLDIVNSTFLAYQFQLDQVRKQVISTASYTTRALTNGRALGRVEVSIPSPEEQEAIVGVIADVEAELGALDRRLKASRAIKQGMMQELLTGRTRLGVGEDLA